MAELRGVPNATVAFTSDQLLEHGLGPVTRLENLASSLPKLISAEKAMLEQVQ